jgi:hypothetical protein
MTMMANKYTSATIPISSPQLREGNFTRADIQLHGVDHAGASYEGRVFLNNPDANADTPTNPENGYAGSFYIFAHGGCFGDVGHCELETGVRAYDKRPKSPILPLDVSVVVTDKLKEVARNSDQITVTIVPVVDPDDYSPEGYNVDVDNCLKFKELDIRLYETPDP